MQTTDAANEASPKPAPVWWRTGWRGRVGWAAGLAVAAVVLSWCYILQARTQPVNSDGAGVALQGWDMLHGNLLLQGWWTADVSFSTFEVPLSALVIAVSGLGADVVHVTAGISYALLVLAAALLARGRARGREGVVRALLAAGIMVAPGLNESTRVLLGSPDHVGVGVPILLTLLLIDRARERWWVPLVMLALLVWAQLDDPVAEFAAAFPVAVVCLVRAGVALCRRRAWRYDAMLGVAAAASYEFTQVALYLIRAAGGYSMQSLSATFIPFSQWGTQLLHTGQNLLLLFGADYFWQQGGLLTAIAIVHMAGVALALAGFLAGIAGLFRGADRVTQVLTVGMLATLAAGAFLTSMQPGYGAHEIIIALPIGAVLAGRAVGPWLLRRRWPQLALGSALGVIAACSLAVLGYSAAQPSVPPLTQSLAGFLSSRGLTSGIGRYWAASITTAASGGQVRVIPVIGAGPASPYTWLTKTSWYDPNKFSANFVLAGNGPASGFTIPVSRALGAFGPPAYEYNFGGYVIMVYYKNLLQDMKPAVQANPDLGQRL